MHLDIAQWKATFCEYSFIHVDTLHFGSQFKWQFGRGIYVIGNKPIDQ